MALRDMFRSPEHIKPDEMTGYDGTILPKVKDPEKAFAGITRDEYQSYVKDFGQFEEQLIAGVDDTSLIDQAAGDARQQSAISEGIQQRNLERYRTSLTSAQRAEMQRANQRQEQLNVAGGTNEARIAQFEQNQRMRSNLMNIASGVYGGALQGMGNAAGNAANRRQAYNQAKAQSRAANIGAAGQIGGMVAGAWMLGLL